MNLESLFNSTEIAEMRELARREAEAEIAAENEKLVKETARKIITDTAVTSRRRSNA